jgi:hypothetical protein
MMTGLNYFKTYFLKTICTKNMKNNDYLVAMASKKCCATQIMDPQIENYILPYV